MAKQSASGRGERPKNKPPAYHQKQQRGGRGAMPRGAATAKGR